MKSTLAFALMLAYPIVSRREMDKARINGPYLEELDHISTRRNRNQRLSVEDINSDYYNTGDELFNFEDDLIGQRDARIFNNFFKEINEKFTYIDGKLLLDVNKRDLEDIKKEYKFPKEETALVHLDISAARWFVANNGSVRLTHVINKSFGKELIYPVDTDDVTDVFDYDISKNPVLPMRLNEAPSDYAKRNESFYLNSSDKKLQSISNKEFFDSCYEFQSSERFRKLDPGTKCSEKIIGEINQKIRFTASSLKDIHFDSNQLLSGLEHHSKEST